eukprot:7378671-Prymnesium_polylepis.1
MLVYNDCQFLIDGAEEQRRSASITTSQDPYTDRPAAISWDAGDATIYMNSASPSATIQSDAYPWCVDPNYATGSSGTRFAPSSRWGGTQTCVDVNNCIKGPPSPPP